MTAQGNFVPGPSHAGMVAFLQKMPLFKEFSREELLTLAGCLREQRLAPAEVVFKEGDAGDAMYLIATGTLVISKAVTREIDQVLVRMGPGEFFGEMSVFDRLPRSATAQAECDATLLVLDRESVERLLRDHPRIAPALLRALLDAVIARLRATDSLVGSVARFSLQLAGFEVEPAA